VLSLKNPNVPPKLLSISTEVTPIVLVPVVPLTTFVLAASSIVSVSYEVAPNVPLVAARR